MRVNVNRLLAIGAGILLAPMAACSGVEVTSASTEPAPVTAWAQIDVPLSQYTYLAADWDTIFGGVAAVQTRCLKRFGFSAMAPTPEVTTWRMQTLMNRYGPSDRSQVEKYGFGTAPVDQAKKSASASSETVQINEAISGVRSDGSPSTLRDTSGKPIADGGCGKEGWDVVRAGYANAPDYVASELASESYSRLLNDQRFLAVETAWAQCAKSAGYDVKHRKDIATLAKGEGKQVEIKIALADLTCAEKVNYVGIANMIDSQIQVDLIRKHEAELRGMVDAQTKVLENAKNAAHS